MLTRHEEIPVIWAEYLNLLEEAKKQLETNKEKFKTELLEQAEVNDVMRNPIVILVIKKLSKRRLQ